MALNPREKKIATVVGVFLVGYVGYMFGVQPYFDTKAQVERDQAKADKEMAIAHNLLDNKSGVKKEWEVLQAGGLKTNAADAESVALHAITDFAANRRVHIDSHKSDAPTQNGEFQQMRVTVTGTGNLDSIWHLLADIETAKAPIQIGDCRISSKKADGSDELTLQLSVNTLFFAPPQSTTKPFARNAAGETL
ncbi:MAG: type II secretion system protein GspM [Phycisphaerae bacterium]